MKNLFQNKNFLLFTLILMASCFGILGVGGEIFAKDSSTPVGDCGGYAECSGLFTTNCHRDCSLWQTPYAACGALSSSCECECNDTCADNYCKSNSETLGICTSSIAVHCMTCPSFCCYNANSRLTGLGKSGQYACKEQLFCKSNNIQSCPNGCDMLTGRCKTASSTNCTSVGTQECVDTTECVGSYTVITSGPRECPGNLTCLKKGTCELETTALCTDGCEEFNRRYCENERWYTDTNSPRTKYCSNCNHCGDDECNCGEDETCSDCKTTTLNPCYWINIGCNLNDECDNQEAEICGPSGCEGKCNGKKRGDTRCVLGSDCNENSGGGAINNGGGMGGSNTGGSGGAVRFTNPLSTNSFEALVMGIINWILGIVVSLAILFLIIGGLMYITSAGDEERIKKAKNIILYAVVGLGVVILSWSIITELKDILGVQ